MADDELESLWSYGDPEPWRRGRFAIGFISVLVLIGFAAGASVSIFNGEVGKFFAFALVGCAAVFLLFLIWLGQNWARWILSVFFAIAGLCGIVWGIRTDGLGLLFVLGMGALTIFCYLALSPAVYEFARRQREHIAWFETIVASVACLLVFASVASGLLAFEIYKSSVERDAIEFAELTFHRVFINRDPHFLEDHSSAARKLSRPGQLINRIDDQLGEVKNVGPFAARLIFKLDGHTLRARGAVRTRVLFARQGFWVVIQISGTEKNWEIEHLSWEY